MTPRAEPVIHGFLQTKAIGLGATVFALDGVHDHVHIVASIPPRLAVAKFIGQIKAVASTRYNKLHPDIPFFLQAEYGAFSFDAKRLPNYIAYVRRQKEHHAQNTLIPVLERTSDSAPSFVRDAGAADAVSDDTWWHEMEGMS